MAVLHHLLSQFFPVNLDPETVLSVQDEMVEISHFFANLECGRELLRSQQRAIDNTK
jgi:hypothetical protein